MITRRDLAARPRELAVAPSFGAAVTAAEERLTGLCVKPRFASRAWLPKGVPPTWVAVAAQEADCVLPGQGAALVADLLLEPFRVYELEAAVPRRVIAVVGSYRRAGSEDVYLALGRLHLNQKGNRVLSSGPLDLALVPIADAVSARAALEGMALSLTESEVKNAKSGRRAVVVGGPINVPAVNWRHVLRAALWPYGLLLDDVLEEPWRREASVNHRLSDRSADVYIFLRRWLIDARGTDHADGLMELVKGLGTIDTAEAATMQGALAAIRRQLDADGYDKPARSTRTVVIGGMPVTDVEAFAPASWKEFQDNIGRLKGK